MNYNFEIVKFDKNIPGRILMQDKPGWRCNTKPHWHKELEFIYMIDGELTGIISGNKKTIRNGEILFCNSKDIHVTSVPDYSANYKFLVVQLSYEKMMSFYEGDDQCYFDISDTKVNHLIKLQMKKLLEISEADVNGKENQFSSIRKNQVILEIYYILLSQCMSKNICTVAKKTMDIGYAKWVMEYICQHYTEKLTLEQIAKEIGLSSQYLSKYFKKATDMGIIQYLNIIRLERANEELLNEFVTVTDAALNNGFSSVKAYITTCKKVFGMTPTQLVEEYRKD